MLKRLYVCGVLLMALALSGCASMSMFSLTPEEAALKQEVIVALGEYYPDIAVSVAGSRVYLNGWVPNFGQKQDVIERAASVPGVKEVVADIYLSDVGPWGGSGWPSYW